MSEKIGLVKNVYNKEQFEKTVNTSFNQLTPPPAETTAPTTSVPQFFDLYRQLFFEIPKEGITDSHSYLVQTSGDYVGNTQPSPDIQPLIDEINTLRSQLVSQQQLIQQLTVKK